MYKFVLATVVAVFATGCAGGAMQQYHERYSQWVTACQLPENHDVVETKDGTKISRGCALPQPPMPRQTTGLDYFNAGTNFVGTVGGTIAVPIIQSIEATKRAESHDKFLSDVVKNGGIRVEDASGGVNVGSGNSNRNASPVGEGGVVQ